MSLLRSSLRPNAALSDAAIERYLAALRSDLAPDPLFRRRLRGTVVNRYVAAREGVSDDPPSRRAMGRVGRAVLYATLALAVSVTGVMAASQEALPGDLLYPLKQQVEALRVRALPAHLHDDLAAHELGVRIEEMGRLAEIGAWEEFMALAAVVDRDYQGLARASDDGGPAGDRHLVVLSGMLEQLPQQARVAARGVLEGLPGIAQRRSPAGVGEAARPASIPAAGGERPDDNVPANGPANRPDGHAGGGPSRASDATDRDEGAPQDADVPGEAPERTPIPDPPRNEKAHPRPSGEPGD